MKVFRPSEKFPILGRIRTQQWISGIPQTDIKTAAGWRQFSYRFANPMQEHSAAYSPTALNIQLTVMDLFVSGLTNSTGPTNEVFLLSKK